jgi:hypothetical protein
VLAKGCFASVIAFAPQNTSCGGCPLLNICADAVFAKEGSIIERVAKTEIRITPGATVIGDVEASKAGVLTRLFRKRRAAWEAGPAPIKPPPEVDPVKLGLSSPDLLKIHAGVNPFMKLSADHPYRICCDFLIAAQNVSLRDFAEHFHDIGSAVPKSTSATHVRKFLKLLISAGVVSKQGSLFCLPSTHS